MVANRKADFFRDVRLEELRSPPAMIGANDFLHHVMQQARQNNFLRHAVLHRQVRALQNMVGRVHEPQLKEIVECGIGRHRRKSSHIFAGARNVHETHAFAVFTGFDLRFDFRDGRIFLRLDLVPCGISGFRAVQFRHHVRFQRVRSRFGVHPACGFRPAKTIEKSFSVNFHKATSNKTVAP